MTKRFDMEHAYAVNYVAIHPQRFGLNMKQIVWMFKEGIWAPDDNNCDYRPFPDFIYMKQDGTGGALEVKRGPGLARHGLEQIASANEFFKQVHNTELSEASLVFYRTMPFKQRWIEEYKRKK